MKFTNACVQQDYVMCEDVHLMLSKHVWLINV